MPTPSTIGLFAGGALVLIAIPGPAVFYVVGRSIGDGRTAGLASVLGIATGSTVHVLAATLGVSALLVASASAFTTVKLAGALYLIWLGLRRLSGRDTQRLIAGHTRGSLRRSYRQGIFVQVLNPKAALFFFAFLPQFVDPERGRISVQVLLFGTLFVGLSICSDATYALLASSVAGRLRQNHRVGSWLTRSSGAVYVALGMAALFTKSDIGSRNHSHAQIGIRPIPQFVA